MATTFVRVFALMLAITGFTATTYTGAPSSGGHTAQAGIDDGGGPVSVCLPSDPTHCGMD